MTAEFTKYTDDLIQPRTSELGQLARKLENDRKLVRRAIMIEAIDQIDGAITGMTVARKFSEITGESIDWHEASDYLAWLRDIGFLSSTGHNASGMTIYSL